MAWLSECLKGFQVKDLPLPKELVTLEHPKQKLSDAIKVLADKHLLSAPVVNAEGKVIGIIDTLDIVDYVHACAEKGEAGVADHDIESLMGRGQARGRFFEKVNMTDTLASCGDKISGPKHRAVVMGENGKPLSVVTQSTLLQFLNRRKYDIKAFNKEDGGGHAKDFGSNGVETVKVDDKALMAVQQIFMKEVSSLVVVDADGKVANVVSSTDIVRGLAGMKDMSSAIAHMKEVTIEQFLGEFRESNIAAVAVHPMSLLCDVLAILAATKVHRVVVMKERVPTGVVSLSDICLAVSNPGRMG